MMKSLLLFFLFAGSFFMTSYAQAPLAAVSNPNFVHDKLTNMHNVSLDVKVPDSIYTIIKNFAHNRNIDENSALREIYMFKILFNENLSVDERLYAATYFVQVNFGTREYTPSFLLKQLQNSLTLRKNK